MWLIMYYGFFVLKGRLKYAPQITPNVQNADFALKNLLCVTVISYLIIKPANKLHISHFLTVTLWISEKSGESVLRWDYLQPSQIIRIGVWRETTLQTLLKDNLIEPFAQVLISLLIFQLIVLL